MDKFYNETLYRLETTIHELEIETDCPIQRIEAVIVLIVNSLSELKKYVLKEALKILMKKSDFLNIRSLLLFQNSFIIMPFIKLKQKSPTEQSP